MAWPKFQTQEEVPEQFRDEYHEVGGEWVAVENGELGEKGKKALEAERAARELAEKRAKEAEIAAKDAREAAEALKAGISESDAKKFKEDTAKAIRAEVEQEIGTLRSENVKLKLEDRVKVMAVKNGVLPDSVDDWWRLVGDRFELDSDGNPAVVGGRGKDVTAFISSDLKKEKAFLYAGSKGDGGGGGGIHDPAGGGGDLTFEQLIANPASALGEQKPA